MCVMLRLELLSTNFERDNIGLFGGELFGVIGGVQEMASGEEGCAREFNGGE